MKNLYASILFSLCSIVAFSQDSTYHSEWVYLPVTTNSIVMHDSFVPRRCKNDLSDSLIILLDSFKNQSFITTCDSINDYSYQFTQTFDFESNFQNKLVENDMCFEIEENRNLKELKKNNKFILYDTEWLAVIIHGPPHIGNSTYWTDYYIYFKRN